MINQKECRELRKLASYARDIPPLELWKGVQSYIEPQDWGLTIFKWDFVARYLDPYSKDVSAPDINDCIQLEGNSIVFKSVRPELWNGARIYIPDSASAQKALNLYRRHINSSCNYYLQLSILVFQAHKDILKVASEQLGKNISYKRSRIMRLGVCVASEPRITLSRPI